MLVRLQQSFIVDSRPICILQVVELNIGVLPNCVCNMVYLRYCNLSNVWIFLDGDCTDGNHVFLRDHGDMEWVEGIFH